MNYTQWNLVSFKEFLKISYNLPSSLQIKYNFYANVYFRAN